ncbi:hypothetical protein AVEN_43880-1 [Araneus ventricosus]|uniref:Uncharacterized protein n=1 Tax=Araneus ventricosus TaxID=182803 RepID=A0A4Y2GQC4_ARAVE|nr:hypothetical protein AVEN_43880-1 [Araneus ventricosus]
MECRGNLVGNCSPSIPKVSYRNNFYISPLAASEWDNRWNESVYSITRYLTSGCAVRECIQFATGRQALPPTSEVLVSILQTHCGIIWGNEEFPSPTQAEHITVLSTGIKPCSWSW